MLRQDIENNKKKYEENNNKMEQMTNENKSKIEEANKFKDDYNRELKLHSEDVYIIKLLDYIIKTNKRTN